MSNRLADRNAAPLNDLMEAVASGDRRAFAELYRETSPRLTAVVAGIVGRSTAEDVLQDVYVSVWQRAHRFDPSAGSAMGWLVAVARNRAIDAHRRLRFDASLDAVSEDALGIEDLATDSSDVTRRGLHGCLQALAPESRNAIRLAFLQGLSHREIARNTATPLGTVKSWIRRGLQSLQECLA